MKHKTAKANVKTKTRLLSLLLAVLITLFCFPVTAIGADEAEEPISETLEETADAGLSAFERGVGELSPEALESMTLNAADVPEVISAQAIAEKNHVLRLREQEENLNTVVFQNRDGGKTVYLYANPVKYVDANGNVKDKSTALKAENITLNGKTYSHSATENVFGQYYPTMPQNGVLITFGQYTVEMAPVITGILTLRDTAVANNKVTYNKVFGNGTSLVYTPTLSGVKEDIILQTYTGKSSFSFTLKTNGLAIVQTESDTFLADFEGNKVASLGKVIITDRANHTAYGSMTVAAKTEREEYTVTVNAPVEFLTSSATVYPVTVDPTVTIYETYSPDGYNYSAIEDLCIYTGGDDPVYNGLSGVGNYFYEMDYVFSSRMLYRITSGAEEYEALANYIDDVRFSSAKLYVRGYNVETDVTVIASPFSYTAWDADMSECVDEETYYSHMSSHHSTTIVSGNMSHSIGFDITAPLIYYREHPSYFNEFTMCLMVDGEGNEYDSECYDQIKLYQTEHANYDVYIEIDYTDLSGSYYINSLETGKFLSANNGDVIQSVYNSGFFKAWSFNYIGNNKYTISITGQSNNVLAMNNNGDVFIGNKSSLDSNYYTWQLISHSNNILLYNISLGEYLHPLSTGGIDSTANSNDSVWRLCKTNAYVPINSVNITDIYLNASGTSTPTIVKGNNNATWSSRSDFTWSSSNPDVADVSTGGTVTAYTEGFSIITATHKPTNVEYKFTTVVDQEQFSEYYYIRNIGSGKGMEQSTYNSAVQNTISTSNEQKIYLTYQNNGYYTIKILYDELESYLDEYYLSYGNGTNTNGTSMIPKENDIPDSALWRIIPTSNGNYKLKSKCAENTDKVLSVTSSTAGEAISQSVYTYDSTYYDEWNIIKLYDAVFLGVFDTDPNHDHVTCFNDIKADLNEMGYYNIGEFAGEPSKKITSKIFLNLIQGAKMIITRGHGDFDYVGLFDGTVAYTDIMGLPENSLCNVELVIYGGCLTGKLGDSNYNMVNGTYSKGAQTVIGFENKIDCKDASTWVVRFFNYLKKYPDHKMSAAVSWAENHTYHTGEYDIKDEYIEGGDNTLC